MQIVVSEKPPSATATRCATCAYLSALGRCQRIKSRFYSETIAFPEDFACSRWEHSASRKEAK